MHVNENFYAKVRGRHESSTVSHVHYYTGGSSKENKGVSRRRNLYAIVVLLLCTALLSLVVLSSMGSSDTSELREHRLREYAKAQEVRAKTQGASNVTATIATPRIAAEIAGTQAAAAQEQLGVDRYSLPYDSRQPLRKLRPSEAISLYSDPSQPKKFTTLHFIHVPKCGGTTMTSIMRKIECVMDPVANVDCCTNPGFCDWHALRRCSAIKGCTNHFAQRQYIMKPHIPSITVLREPSSRLLSAFFYRGHSPNNDFFQVCTPSRIPQTPDSLTPTRLGFRCGRTSRISATASCPRCSFPSTSRCRSTRTSKVAPDPHPLSIYLTN